MAIDDIIDDSLEFTMARNTDGEVLDSVSFDLNELFFESTGGVSERAWTFVS